MSSTTPGDLAHDRVEQSWRSSRSCSASPMRCIYVICTELNLPLVTYHPVIGEVDVLYQHARSATRPGHVLVRLDADVARSARSSSPMSRPLCPKVVAAHDHVCGVIAALGYLDRPHDRALRLRQARRSRLELLKSRWASAVVARRGRRRRDATLHPRDGMSGSGTAGFGSSRSGHLRFWATI